MRWHSEQAGADGIYREIGLFPGALEASLKEVQAGQKADSMLRPSYRLVYTPVKYFFISTINHT